jgi:hypothetical protein
MKIVSFYAYFGKIQDLKKAEKLQNGQIILFLANCFKSGSFNFFKGQMATLL